MRASSIVASFVLCASFAVAGCAANASHSDPSEETDENGNALSKIDAHLAGAFAGDWEFGHLVLKADGTYFAETQIECITTPCIDPREDGTWRSSDFSSKTTGYVTLRPTGQASRKYSVSIATDGSGIKLSRKGVTSRLDSTFNWCSDTVDCQGQRVRALGLMCMKGSSYHTVCDVASNGCLTKCITDAACKVTHCGVDCADTDRLCNMMITEQAKACYAKGTCGRDESGACAWLDQPRIDACLDGH